MNDTPSYKKWVVTQLLAELAKKLKRLKEDSSEYATTLMQIDRLKKDRDQ